MVYSAIDIAIYIIAYESSKGRRVSNLRLQKLLYFIQANLLIEANKPCFSEKIEAWDFGPVVPEIYHKYKIYGSEIIPCVNGLNDINIDSRDSIYINEMLDQCSDYSTTKLVSITHGQTPWKNAHSNTSDNVISHAAIKEYFGD